MLDYDLTGLERSSQSQSSMTERSLLKSFHSLTIFSALFSFCYNFPFSLMNMIRFKQTQVDSL